MSSVSKVLIVDDDRSTGQVLSEIVKRIGLRPLVANRPADAINLAKLQYVQGAIVDVLLPKMSGVDLVSELRKTKFADGPVILVSGVFKDKTFIDEAMGKSGAIAYLVKPFNLDELVKIVESNFADIIGVEKWTVSSLLMRQLVQPRERSKAIERLEGVKGYDLPFVLTFLMEAGLSGDLTIASASGEVFGARLLNGEIAELDSEGSRQRSVQALIERGLLVDSDWQEFRAKMTGRFSITDLVQAGFVSPHSMAVAQRAQIRADIQTICESGDIELNFAPNAVASDPHVDPLDLREFMGVLGEILEEETAITHLREFYKEVMKYPIRVVGSDEAFSDAFSSPEFFEMGDVRAAIQTRRSIEQLLEIPGESPESIFRCIHRLVLFRVIGFEDEKRAIQEKAALERYKKVYETLKDRRPDQIFVYFGAAENASPAFIEKIYQDYVRSSNPKSLPADVSDELVEYCTKCFELISTAREIMTDERRRAELFDEISAENEAKNRRANVYLNGALDLIKKGNFKGSLDQLAKAEAAMPSTRCTLLTIWAKVKSKNYEGPSGLHDFLRTLDQLSAEDRRSPQYYMAMGLVKRALGDATAPSFFERALQLDPSFIEARREIHGGKAEKKSSKIDIFNDDITTVVSNLFKRKSK